MNNRNQTQQQQPKAKPARASSKASGRSKGTNTTEAKKENGMDKHVVEGREIKIPLGLLDISEHNARKSKRGNIEALAASIKAQGQLQNIVVHRGEDGRYKAAGGGRRFLAFKLLEESGDWTAEQEIRALLVDADDALAASLAENMHEAMHPADEFEAFKKLVDDNWTIDRIADAFGVTPLVVERRLRLIAAAPELIEEFRAGELSTDQLIALCATDDHDRQLQAWKRAKGRHWMEGPKDLRKAVLAEGEIDVSSDRRIGFIGGLDVYRAAGGDVRRDLFSGDGSGGFITDEALLDSLVADKLEEHAAAVRAEGWGWVELWPEFDHGTFNRLGHAPQVLGEIPKKPAAKLADLRAKLEAAEAELQALHDSDTPGDYTDEESERMDELYQLVEDTLPEQIEAIEQAHRAWTPEVKASAGALVILDRGELRIERGMVRTSDRKAVQAAAGDDSAVSGGRETESAGRKPDAVSDALRRSLIGHRNLAAQGEVAKRPDVAKVLLACWTVEHIRSRVGGGYRGVGVPSDFAISDSGYGGGRGQPITDDEGQEKAQAFAAECIALAKKLPDAEGKLWDALAAMTGEELDKLIAYGVALTVSLSDDHKGLTAKLLQMLGFDMAAHFTPTAGNYLGRMSKPLMVEALTEAGKIKDEADKTFLLAFKKGALATEAESRLAGSGWVPKGIRTPKPKGAPKPKAPAKKATAKKKAATKAKAKA